MDTTKLLPIGSVILIKGAVKPIVIAGYMISDSAVSDKVFDYVGYPYPQGFTSKDINFGFNHNQIEKIIYMGYDTQDYHDFLNILNNKVGGIINEK